MANKKIPMRQCIGCREMKAKKDMIRVLKTASAEDESPEVILDATGRKHGRGAYICPNRDCLELAMKNKGLERSFKMAISKDVYEMLAKEMEQLETR